MCYQRCNNIIGNFTNYLGQTVQHKVVSSENDLSINTSVLKNKCSVDEFFHFYKISITKS
jgi:hypothetical protein